jgi:hypothetical protein
MKCRLEWLIIFVVLGAVSVSTVFASPSGPSSVTNLGSSRYSSASAANVSALAGNVTELNFVANTITKTWQGYFGNITGTIVLGNSNNQSMYNWNITSPSGEIYATRTSGVPTWASVVCASAAQTTTEDTTLGVNSTTDQDAVNRTFLNTTAFSNFYVGNISINSTQNCRAVNLYNGSTAPSSSFQEVLLHDGTSMIYTALITQDANGFDNRTHDFQMLVGENGHGIDVATTPYYFYLELQ